MMSNVTGITGNLCNKCPKWLVEQISGYSDYFNAISGFTSNSRAPGGPVTDASNLSSFDVCVQTIILSLVSDFMTGTVHSL